MGSLSWLQVLTYSTSDRRDLMIELHAQVAKVPGELVAASEQPLQFFFRDLAYQQLR